MKDVKKKYQNHEMIKKALIQRKNELENELSDLQSKMRDEVTQDPADQAAQAEMESLQNSLQNNELAEYKMIVKALDMIANGTYGYCVDCGQPISEKRLLSFPNASRCIVCQEKSEAL